VSSFGPEYQVDRCCVRVSIRAMGEAWIATAEERGGFTKRVTQVGFNPTTLMIRLMQSAILHGFAGVRRV
jgi:hypothetical protein